MTIYQKIKEAGLKTDCWQSDLYVEDSQKARELLKDVPSKSFFFDNIDRKRWIEVPFAFDPFWERKTA